VKEPGKRGQNFFVFFERIILLGLNVVFKVRAAVFDRRVGNENFANRVGEADRYGLPVAQMTGVVV
jgi:hypothetical protein